MEHLIHILHALVIMLYLAIAFQFFSSFTRVRQVKGARRALLYMVTIFILCAMTGYLFDLISVPLWVSLLSHVLLVTASAFFVLTNQVQEVAKALRDD